MEIYEGIFEFYIYMSFVVACGLGITLGVIANVE